MHTIMSSDVSNIHIYTRRSNVKIKGSQAINNLQMIRVNKRSWNFKRIIICQHFIAFTLFIVNIMRVYSESFCE